MAAEHPQPRPLDPGDPIRPTALVLPAVAHESSIDERSRWLERSEIVDAYEIRGAETPVYLTEAGVAITTTGLGKATAATTVATLCSTPGLDLEDAPIMSVGVAGGPPSRSALGSVFIADAVVDWDRKHRWDERETNATDGEPPIDLLAYAPMDSVRRLEKSLVDRAATAAQGAELVDRSEVRTYQRRYPQAVEAGPAVGVGPTVSGDEFWHGSRYAAEVDWLCERYGVSPYATTQMEDVATATALERFDALERYLSLRAVVNYDRPAPDQSVAESFDGTEESLEQGLENVYRVGSRIVEALLER